MVSLYIFNGKYHGRYHGITIAECWSSETDFTFTMVNTMVNTIMLDL